MTIDKVKFPLLGFHITNVCNYNCEHCQTFSNYKFKGHQLWNDYKKTVEEWSKKLAPDRWQLAGGEPTLNPTWQDWISGLANLFPGVPGEMSTNGSTIKYTDDFYKFLVNQPTSITIRIQTHNIDKKNEFVENIRNWLKGDIVESRYNDEYDLAVESKTWIQNYNNVKDPSWPDCQTFGDCVRLSERIIDECMNVFDLSDPRSLINTHMGYKFVDCNGVTITVQNSNIFGTSTLIPLADRSGFRLHNSNPVKAHDACISRLCRSITNGKWYKCHTSAHLEEFRDQFHIELDDPQDQQLISNVDAATADMSLEELQQWFDRSFDPIPQCKFCPESMQYVKHFKATTKKINFQRRSFSGKKIANN